MKTLWLWNMIVGATELVPVPRIRKLGLTLRPYGSIVTLVILLMKSRKKKKDVYTPEERNKLTRRWWDLPKKALNSHNMDDGYEAFMEEENEEESRHINTGQ
ncbi:hypothetical protein B0H13DRAFT_1901662 [Mycena leptocephala]|nr:hypothetical protein B0H13DRAFT_1901662 [Mycena leptocephala]